MSGFGWEGDRYLFLKVASTTHLRLNGCVILQVKMYCSSASGGLRF